MIGIKLNSLDTIAQQIEVGRAHVERVPSSRQSGIGDLRAIWRQAVSGLQEERKYKGSKGRIYTVYRTENVLEDNIREYRVPPPS